MGERLLCKQEVNGSIPFTSTTKRLSAARSRAWRHGDRERQNSGGFACRC